MTCKSTIYLPDDLKRAVERVAVQRGCSEAEVIRQAVATAVGRPAPSAGFLDGEAIADRVDELLVGFGTR
ncbi:MAG: ribbon-helix-helix domain-containing protein [Actinomycetota bacterium]|nr:ribbon-helix-helix domain-containing protein [Actinomycetota bacterium]